MGEVRLELSLTAFDAASGEPLGDAADERWAEVVARRLNTGRGGTAVVVAPSKCRTDDRCPRCDIGAPGACCTCPTPNGSDLPPSPKGAEAR